MNHDRSARRRFRKCLVITSFFLFWPVMSQAAHHALLISVGRYSPSLDADLEGPPHDAEALGNRLVKLWKLPPENLTILVNEQATKARIMAALESLEDRIRPGDTVFIYFSGHGTSYFGERSRENGDHDPSGGREGNESDRTIVGLHPYTGALLPHDFSDSSPGRASQSLLIGTRDLKPIFQRLEKKGLVLVVFDACFSGRTVRGIRSHRPRPRYRTPARINPIAQLQKLGLGKAPDPKSMQEAIPPFPYEKVIYISASGCDQKAEDITSTQINQGWQTTVDGKPHGALTDALLRGLDGHGDTDHNGQITINELYHFVKSYMNPLFAQRPGLLFNRFQTGLLDRVLVRTDGPTEETGDGGFRLKFEGKDPDLAARLQNLPGVQMVTRDFDLAVIQDDDQWSLSLLNGYELTSYPLDQPEQVVDRVRRQVLVKRLVGLEYPDQGFNVFLDLKNERGFLVEGDLVSIRIRPETDAFILLINISPSGKTNVIYPATTSELARVQKHGGLDLKDIGEVVPDFGTEYLKVFAFKDHPGGLEAFLGKTISPEEKAFDDLVDLVTRPGNEAAQATLTVKTMSRKDFQNPGGKGETDQ